MTACLDDETLGAWSAGDLPDDEAARAVEHAAACARCAAIIADAVGAATTAVATVGRFELRRLLGSGGMGVVFDAWDPLLQRPVAVKMIRALAADAADRERLIAEGRALARLAHRHVVTVYDCGSAGDEVYLAMAQVRGASLARWLDAAPRSVAERRRVLEQIADGLAAIHAAGLVHRDLKADNVVVDERGDAVVIDLGLARALDRPARGGGSTPAGTPSVWAPEVAAGRAATAASDQHGWWQLVALALPAPRGRRLAQALARGLAAEPDARFPSMTAAAAALRASAPWPRRRWWALGGAVVAVGAAATLVVTRGAAAERPSPCAPIAIDAARHLRAVTAALTAAGRDAAPVIAELRRRVAEADALGAQACRDERSRDRAVADAARHLRACAEAVWRDNAEALEGAAAPGAELGRALEDVAVAAQLDACASGAVPATPAPPPHAQAAAVAELEAALRAVRIDDTGAPAARLAALDALGARIAAAGYQPLIATWHNDRADLLRGAGRLDAVDAELVAAANAAAAAGDDDLRARALLNRLRLAFMLGRPDTAAIEADAAAAVARMRNAAMTAELDVSIGRVRTVAGDYPAAVERLTAALAIYDALPLPTPRRTTAVLQDLGGALQMTGALDRAQTIYDRGYALAAAAFGPDAAATLELRGARATNLMYREQPEAAAELAAVADGLARQGAAASPELMAVQGYRCELAIAADDRVGGREVCPAAVAIGAAVFGPDSPQLVWPLIVDARFALLDGAPGHAAAQLERALAISATGAPNPLLPALAAGHLARAYRVLHDRRAAAQLRTARAALTAQADQPEAAALLAELAD